MWIGKLTPSREEAFEMRYLRCKVGFSEFMLQSEGEPRFPLSSFGGQFEILAQRI